MLFQFALFRFVVDLLLICCSLQFLAEKHNKIAILYTVGKNVS